MKRNVFGAAIVAGGLALFTGVAGFAVDYTTGTAAQTAVNQCADQAKDAVTAADTTALKGEAIAEAAALKAETLAGIEEIRAEAKSNIEEAVAEAKDEDGTTNAADLTAELNAIVDESCKAIVSLKNEFDKALAELVAESTNVEQPEANNADVEKPENDKRDSERKSSEKRGSDREGND
jgi:hypothetical protein